MENLRTPQQWTCHLAVISTTVTKHKMQRNQ